MVWNSYFNRERDTKEKYAGNYLLTGDLGRKDEEGYFWFFGRKDDVITSAGYRIGPAEIEDCLLKVMYYISRCSALPTFVPLPLFSTSVS
jgi:acyl-coenzyme A synthetase/AMP-(fatty) acid ligase